MNNVEKLLDDLLKEVRGMREDLALTLALKRKHLNGKSPKYLEFEEWALERKSFDTSMVMGKFCSKPTALSWMSQFVSDHKEFTLRRGWGQEPHRVVLLKK